MLAGMVQVGGPTVTTDIGVTGGLDVFADKPIHTPDDAFPPASDFDTSAADNPESFLFTVTGDALTAAPEPPSFILLGLAGAFLVAPKLRSRRS
jgi:hypothetical protein